MTQSRRDFLTTSAAAATITVIPFGVQADGHSKNAFNTPGGEVIVHPINHASLVLETPAGVILVDPVTDSVRYGRFSPAPYVLITHEHGDHFRMETLEGVTDENTKIIANQAVFDQMPSEMQSRTTVLANGESGMLDRIQIDAIGAYNLTEERKNFHPEGRDNGYIINLEGFRIYVSGDTEDIPEMRALQDIDLAFVCMNLPFTMDAAAAADAVKAFAPRYVYPYHYRGRGDGTQDPTEFARLVGDAAEVKLSSWYG